jgi:hypothetical protein
MRHGRVRRRADHDVRRPRSPRLLLAALAALAALASAGAALADPPPPPPGTFLQCTFDNGKNGGTTCVTTTNTVDGPFCFDDATTIATYGSPVVVYDVEVVVSTQKYPGNAVTGTPVVDSNGTALYYTAVKPHANLVYDSGPHASFYRLVNAVDSC